MPPKSWARMSSIRWGILWAGEGNVHRARRSTPIASLACCSLAASTVLCSHGTITSPPWPPAASIFAPRNRRWSCTKPNEAWLGVGKDLLDQQIIDTNGRKVVRVNDIDLADQRVNGNTEMRITQVDVGLPGAVRRLLQGVIPPMEFAVSSKSYRLARFVGNSST